MSRPSHPLWVHDIYLVRSTNYEGPHYFLLLKRNWLHGAESFLRSRQLCSYSRISQYFTKPEGSLPCSQEPSTGPYPDPDQSSLYHPTLLSKIYFNIIQAPTSWSFKWCFSFWLSHQYHTYAFIFTSIRATCPAHLILLVLIIVIILGKDYKFTSSPLTFKYSSNVEVKKGGAIPPLPYMSSWHGA
jgi:hypothetical protein